MRLIVHELRQIQAKRICLAVGVRSVAEADLSMLPGAGLEAQRHWARLASLSNPSDPTLALGPRVAHPAQPRESRLRQERSGSPSLVGRMFRRPLRLLAERTRTARAGARPTPISMSAPSTIPVLRMTPVSLATGAGKVNRAGLARKGGMGRRVTRQPRRTCGLTRANIRQPELVVSRLRTWAVLSMAGRWARMRLPVRVSATAVPLVGPNTALQLQGPLVYPVGPTHPPHPSPLCDRNLKAA